MLVLLLLLLRVMIVFLLDPLAKVLDAGPETDSGGPADSGGAGSGSGCAASATVCSVSARPGCRQRDSEPRRLGVTVRVTQAASGSHGARPA